jgi:signal transduction histidine kinase
VTRPVAGGVVVVQRPGSAIDQRVAEAVLPIAVLGMAVLAVAVLVAIILSRRLSRPFIELAGAAERLGEGTFDVDIREQRLPEAAAIARALERSKERLAELVRRERAFASNASHQLRTPLTALRLQIEDLTLQPELDGDTLRQELSTAIAEIDRLSETVTSLLSLARSGSLGTAGEVRLDDLAAQTAERWRPTAERAGRSLEVAATEPVQVHSPAPAVCQILDVLIENAIDHGAGTVRVEVTNAAEHAQVLVRDDGPGIPPGEVDRAFTRRGRGASATGEGIGLALASEVAQRLGGSLAVRPGVAPTTFELTLPTRRTGEGTPP